MDITLQLYISSYTEKKIILLNLQQNTTALCQVIMDITLQLYIRAYTEEKIILLN